jgi:hypothetical protein
VESFWSDREVRTPPSLDLETDKVDIELPRLAMAMNLHLEPELPSSSQPEELLDVIWMNELRKRTWLGLVAWDKYDYPPLSTSILN